MQRLPIARSFRLALVGLTVVLAVIAGFGVASLYNSRQRYEDRLSAKRPATATRKLGSMTRRATGVRA